MKPPYSPWFTPTIVFFSLFIAVVLLWPQDLWSQAKAYGAVHLFGSSSITVGDQYMTDNFITIRHVKVTQPGNLIVARGNEYGGSDDVYVGATTMFSVGEYDNITIPIIFFRQRNQLAGSSKIKLVVSLFVDKGAQYTAITDAFGTPVRASFSVVPQRTKL